MATAAIRFDGAAGPKIGTINTIVQLTNSTVETTYLWQLLDKPEGSATVLSNTAIANPTFTPDCEGSYLIRLTVNLGNGAQEQVDQQELIIRDLKTLERAPAAGETTEEDAVRGWAKAANRYLKRISGLAADSGITIGFAGQVGLQRLHVLRVNGTSTLKAGLPGAEKLPVFVKALATTRLEMMHPLFVLDTGVDGGSAPGNGDLIRARKDGMIYGITGTGTEAVGDPIYVSDTGGLSWLTPGTIPRQIGMVAAQNGASYDALIEGHATLRQQSAPLFFGAATLSDTGAAAGYLGPGYFHDASPTTPVELAMATPGALWRITITVQTVADDDTEFTVILNGAPSLLTIVLPSGDTQISSVSESLLVPYAKDDRISVQWTNAAGTTAGAEGVVVSLERVAG